MASSSFLIPFIFSLFLHYPLSSDADLHQTRLFGAELLSHAAPKDVPVTRFFEVTKPIKVPRTEPCSVLVLQHDFGYTYGRPPVLAQYTPPSDCPSQKFSKIVLEWNATCKGRQFDRIFGVWLGGVELLRSCTAEPRATGIVWTVKKDITRYSSLLKDPQTLAVYLGNLVDRTYTGIYHVNITFHFWPAEEPFRFHKPKWVNSVNRFNSPADLVLPISRNLPLNDGLWFLVENSTDVQLKQFSVPRNAYRAILEVYVSFHSDDEFWYGNPPNNYIAANNLTGTPGNGPFREVVVSLDGTVVGAVWPFTVIYTGGVNPLLWRPITGIGSFDLPSYDIDITPFLGKILDGKQHQFGFSVTNALSVWFIDANLHVWLDKDSKRTEGELIEYSTQPLMLTLVSDFKGLDGNFLTTASRSIFSSGWLKSSHGNITTHSNQDFVYRNMMEFGNDGNQQIVNQTIDANTSVYERLLSDLYLIDVSRRFPLYLYTDLLDQGNGTYASVSNLSLGFNQDIFSHGPLGFSSGFLKNLQTGQGSMIVKGNLVTSGLGSTQQVYTYDGTDGCYFRNVSSRNYTILYDQIKQHCNRKRHLSLGFEVNRRSFPARRAFLASALHYQKKQVS
ncbi:PREDICTED: peptide-N4-(N-acetyl-beta-glucosaminyl)asparagine amidase A-like isoform X2 [Nelumbo nucifera]|uniref:Peptide-N4-(N-acetyl-beta- glucosaminyl)asparagine amidase A-like isoform X2 n=1 Tax=Nelumbo nucifera TaxID=4432 RepID=A0A1U8BB76_NELNU|nr:PREDICTED: peptide-N4-(N-acetyl-beta-glucosaminyl)asparagine amidase A-like isoform X2 [Nelumbo nucifera]